MVMIHFHIPQILLFVPSELQMEDFAKSILLASETALPWRSNIWYSLPAWQSFKNQLLLNIIRYRILDRISFLESEEAWTYKKLAKLGRCNSSVNFGIKMFWQSYFKINWGSTFHINWKGMSVWQRDKGNDIIVVYLQLMLCSSFPPLL